MENIEIEMKYKITNEIYEKIIKYDALSQEYLLYIFSLSL